MNSLLEQTARESIAATDPRMQRAMRAMQDLPPFPATLTKLMASLANENTSLLEIGELVEKDTVVSGNILGLVNSALYGRQTTVTSVRHGLTVLGTNKVRNVALSLQVSGLWSNAKCPQALSIARFNQHSSAVALLSDFLAQQVDVEYPEGAFVAGLLHDVGRLILALGAPEDFDAVLAMHRETGDSLDVCECTRLNFTHAQLSAETLRIWKLAEPVRRAVAHHHDAAKWRTGDGLMPLSVLLSAADRFANSVDLSTFPTPGGIEPDFACLQSLGFPKEKAVSVAREFATEFQATAQFYR